MPAPFNETAILDSLLQAISQAKDYILIEDQYFRAPILIDRIVDRMLDKPDLVLIVVTNPINEWVDPGCWQTYLAGDLLKTLFPDRFRTYKTLSFDAWDTGCTFCWDETDARFVPHSLHSKLVIIDDTYVEIGSANSNNRGLLYEGELAVVVFDKPFATQTRHAVLQNLAGKDYKPSTPPAALIPLLDARAAKNQAAHDNWAADGMDLDLDGDPIPPSYVPEGFLYPLDFGDPSDCLIENVGADVT
jgi:phosphatidylserine/phosphatidylglycerophosphate/cardiolipin synthase-like enzyme